MDGRRRQNWDRNRRSQNRRPPRGTCSWQPTVPSWEKEFCKVVGSLDWETLLQMKKFMHLYEDVLKWDDSAGEEAFFNAKKRFWAEINGLPCDIPLPDPDLYIDRIDWDSEVDTDQQLPEFEFEFESVTSNNADKDHHDPVIIFGDSLLPDQAYSITGWGDDDENFKVPANSSSANHGAPWEQNWGNFNSVENNGAAIGWSGYSNNAWNFGDGSGTAGYMNYGGGWNNEWGWNYDNNNNNNNNNNVTYEVGPGIEHNIPDREQGNFGSVNVGGYVSSERASRVEGHDHYRNNIPRNQDGRHKEKYWAQQSPMEKRGNSREWNSFNSCGPVSHNAGITVGQMWNR